MTVLSDRVDALEATNANLISVLSGLSATMQAQIAAGRGLVWQGTWSTATAYTDVDAVFSGGTSYVCIAAHTSGSSTEPGVGASWETYWDVLASSGGEWYVAAGAGVVTFASADGLGFSTGDLRGADGDGFTGGSYDGGTGVITFTSDDGLGFSTGDVRGADGATWLTGSGVPASGLGDDGDLYLDTATGDYYTKAAGSWSLTGNLKGDKGDTGDGFTGGSYDAGSGTVTFTSDDGLGFSTGDLRGADGADLDWQGAWVTSTAFVVNQAVENDGASYVCTADHTSGASTEPGVGGSWQTVWDLMAAKGADGAGSGTVTSVDVTGGTGIDSSGGPITTSGAITIDLDAATIDSLALADTATQPGDLATVATTGAYSDLSGTPSIPVSGTDFVAKSGGTFTGNVTFDEITETVHNLTGTDLDPANGTIQYKSLSGNVTLTESLADGQSVLLRIANGDTHTANWFTVTWVGGSAPTLTADDVLVFWQEGTTVYGNYLGSVA